MMKRNCLKGTLMALLLLGLFWLNGCFKCVRYDYKTVHYKECQGPTVLGGCTEWKIESREVPYCVEYERK